MSAPKISEQEKIVLRNIANKELKRLELCFTDQGTVQLLDSFKNKFNICETVYKVILAEHQKRKGKSNTTYLKVNMTQVPYVLSFAGYSFDRTLLSKLFGGKPSANGKTVKNLRDATTHGIDEKAVAEIVARKEELFGYMDAFLTGIRSLESKDFNL